MRLVLLATLSATYGFVGAWVFRRFTSAARLRAAMNHIVAHILELRLFVDEPRLIFRAQRDLLLANFRLLRQIAGPALLLAIPFASIYVPMDRYFGTRPLRIGEATLVEAKSIAPDLDLIAPFGVSVETPALRVARENLTTWRVRALSPVNGNFRTRPVDLPVIVRAPAARILGMPWVAAFALSSGIFGLLARAIGPYSASGI